MRGVFIACEASCYYSNGRHFGPCAPTQGCHFDNRASCAGYPGDQANRPTFQRKLHRRRDSCATDNICCRLVNVYRTHHQPSVASGRRQLED
jgi:hypothetical protein